MKHYKNIVLHIPHASTAGLESSGWPVCDAFRQKVFYWTDWYTEEMFDGDVLNGGLQKIIKKVVFPLSRFIVDAERLINDPLEQLGQGIIYRCFDGFQRNIDSTEKIRLMDLYLQHQNNLKNRLTPQSLLIDCHSFPSSLSEVDVCIGYNEDWSQPPQEVLDLVASTFRHAGYRVGVNTPYSNSISPLCDFTYHSLMIELNKRIYMDETTFQLKKESGLLHALIVGLYVQLLQKEE